MEKKQQQKLSHSKFNYFPVCNGGISIVLTAGYIADIEMKKKIAEKHCVIILRLGQ